MGFCKCKSAAHDWWRLGFVNFVTTEAERREDAYPSESAGRISGDFGEFAPGDNRRIAEASPTGRDLPRAVRRQLDARVFPDVVPNLSRDRAARGLARDRLFAIMPFIAASVGVMFGGTLSDWPLRRGKSANLARKLPIIAGLLLASTITLANYVQSNTAVIAIMSVAFFAQGMAALGWTLISDIAPDGLLGATGDIFNFAANLAGTVTSG
jgi:hypothetical protein